MENEDEIFGHLLAIELMINLLATRMCLDQGPGSVALADALRNDMRKNLDAIKLPDDREGAGKVQRALVGADKALRRMLADDSRAFLMGGKP